jgi:uncharacterized protein (TIGR03435 family)
MLPRIAFIMLSVMFVMAQPSFLRADIGIRIKTTLLRAAKASPSFEVISIRPSKKGSMPSITTEITEDGYRAHNQSFWSTIMAAYFGGSPAQWRDENLIGAPSWAVNNLYDIDAGMSAADQREWQDQGIEKEMWRLALQAALRDRCKLVVHRSVRESPIFTLTLDGQSSNLKRAIDGETHPSNAVAIPGDGWMIPGNGRLVFFQTSMASLASFLSGSSDRPILDRTGLKEKYDFVMIRKVVDSAAESDPYPATPWDIEHLGLKIKSSRAPTETIVIYHIEIPSAN